MNTVREQEIARYVEQVRQALADLPPQVRDELLEDLPEHLAEVAAETDGPLADRLGPPQAYAAELRGAAGVRAPTAGRNLDRKIEAAVVAALAAARARLRAADTKVGPVIGYARASEYLRLLRPAWWVFRGYLAAMLITMVLGGPSFGLLPRIGGSTLAALLLLVAAVLGSVWLGRRSDRFGTRRRLALHGAALVLVVFGLYAFVELDGQARGSYYNYEPAYNDPYSNIQDVYVYDSEGRLIEGARLFDQNGQPIQLGYPWCPQAQQFPDDQVRRSYPFCPDEAPFRLREPTPPAAPAPITPDPEPTASTDEPSSPAPTAPVGSPGPTGLPAPTGSPASGDPAATTPPPPGAPGTPAPTATG